MKKPTSRRLCTLIGIIGGVFAGIMASGLVLETIALVWGSYYYSYDIPRVMPLAGAGRELAAAMMTVGSLFFLASLAVIGAIKLIGVIREFKSSETNSAQEIARLKERLRELEQRPDVPIEVIRERNARFSLAGISFCLVVGIIMAQAMTFLVELAFLPVVLGLMLGLQHFILTEKTSPAEEIKSVKQWLGIRQGLVEMFELDRAHQRRMQAAREQQALEKRVWAVCHEFSNRLDRALKRNPLSPEAVRTIQEFERFADGLMEDERTADLGEHMKRLARSFWSLLFPEAPPKGAPLN